MPAPASGAPRAADSSLVWQRSLGAVSVIGPTRMDYACAIASVRDAASELSRFVEDVYEDN